MDALAAIQIGEIRALYEIFGGTWNEVNLAGFHTSTNPKADLFDDVLMVATDTEIHFYPGTTHPSLSFTIHPITYQGITGAAHLCPGFHANGWQVGIHAQGTAFAHLALIQTGAPVNIWRDVDEDFIYTPGRDPLATGWWGINIHRSGLNDPRNIGDYSAGCQVFENHLDQQEVMRIIMNSQTYKQNNKARFSYMLFDLMGQFPMQPVAPGLPV